MPSIGLEVKQLLLAPPRFGTAASMFSKPMGSMLGHGCAETLAQEISISNQFRWELFNAFNHASFWPAYLIAPANRTAVNSRQLARKCSLA
jgi:hypothetical protein